MCRHQHKQAMIMKTQGNMTPPKETNKAPPVDSEELKTYEMSDRIQNKPLKKFRESQENRDRKLNEIQKAIQEYREKFDKEIETS